MNILYWTSFLYLTFAVTYLITINLIVQTQTESGTDRLNVPRNMLDVPTDLRTKKWDGNCLLSPLPHPWLG